MRPLPTALSLAIAGALTTVPVPSAGRPILHEQVQFDRDESRVALPDEIAAPAADEHVIRPDPFTHTPDARTGGDDHLVYNVVWDPSVAPFKRGGALDKVRPGGEFGVAEAAQRIPVPVVGGKVAPGREAFRGAMTVELRPGQPTALPTPAADLRILQARTSPDVPVRFSRDSADNLYVESLSGGRQEVRLALVVDARSDYFGGPDALPAGGAARLPVAIQERADAVLDAIGGRTLPELVAWFRSFQAGALTRDWDDLYLDIALSRIGVCRHRSYAFVITALAANIPARFVYNEAHAFVEVRLRDRGWRRIDLGGAALSFDLRNPSDSPAHTPRYGDPFPKPQEYLASSTRGSIPRPSPARGAGDPPAAGGGAASANETGDGGQRPDPPTAQAGAASSSSPQGVGADDPTGGAPSPGNPAPVQVLDIPVHLTPSTSRRDKVIRLTGRADQPFKPALLAEDGDLILHEWPAVVPRGGAFVGRIQIPADIPPGRYRVVAISVLDP